ncbi:MAG TPA: type IX secretion system outer membrane channel protein PorV [Paludibacteraceae bacterium]|nr:type IX secretion system outer membrane channel protein PorV [Paludibacteraceae bacterium]
MKKVVVSIFVFCTSLTVLAAEDATTAKALFNPLLTGVPSLSIAPDAVAGGMGDVGVATIPDVNSQHWNSSKYAQAASNAGFAFSYTPWLRSIVNDIDLAYLAGYYKISDLAGTVSASFRYFSLGEIQLRENADAKPIPVKPYELAFDAGYSRMLSEHFSMGVAFRFIVSDLSVRSEESYPGSAFSADINGYYALPIDIKTGESKLGIGFNLSNLGTKVSYDKGETSNFLPTDLRLGVSYLVPFDRYNRLSISADFDKLLVPSRKSKFTTGYDPNDDKTWAMSDEQYNNLSVMKGLAWSFADAPGGFAEEMSEINFAIGAEYAYNEQFFARAGYHNESVNKGNRKYFTVGAGFKMSAFKLDVGYVVSMAQNNPLDQTLRFSLAFDVDGIKALVDK